MKIRLFLVRHGETIWNKEKRFQGQIDIPLNQQGIIQSKIISKRLAGLTFDVCYASNLSRAKETAALIAEPHHLPVQECAELREMNFGLWEGLTLAQIKENSGEELSAWWADPMNVRPPQGETLSEVVERTTQAVQSIVQQNQNHNQTGNILLVTHGGVIRCLVAKALEMSFKQYWRIRQDNVALSIIEYYQDDKAVLTLLNDCSHLSPIPMED